MTDERFIKQIIQKGEEAEAKVRSEFSSISVEQLNWQPNPGSWSIAQCLEHLLVADASYFDDLKKIAARKYEMTFWERNSPFSSLIGRLMKDQLKEQVGRKMVAPKIIQPNASEKGVDFVETYLQNLTKFLEQLSACSNVDLDKTIITSPIIKIVTYSLRDAFQFLMQHEHRHINQAIRVKRNNRFP